MTEPPVPHDASAGPVVIGRDGVRAGWVWVAVTAGVGALLVAGWVLTDGTFLLGAYGVGGIAFAFATAVTLVRRDGGARMVLDDTGITVRDRRGEYACAWPQVLEVGAGPSQARTDPQLVVMVRPEGSRWSVPGPNATYDVALPVFGAAARRRARDRIREVCERHDVPFADDVNQMMYEPRPDSPLRQPPRAGRQSPPGEGQVNRGSRP